MLESGAWLKNAEQANRCAARLEAKLCDIPGVEVSWPCQANAVFVKLPERVSERLRERGWKFYTINGPGDARLMCSWDTSDADVDALVGDVREMLVGE
jgi:threonine aldolase